MCKLANQAQIQALQENCHEDVELVYYTANSEETEDTDNEKIDNTGDQPLQGQCML